jgi:hypothetical protein
MEWQPIETAPKDGTRIWAVLGEGARERNPHWVGRSFEIRHEGTSTSGFDLGWSLFPGFGGVDDHWFAGWMPLPPPPVQS